MIRHRTVTDAAVALGLAPSSVSEQIRALEQSLGVTLFDRTARGMRPTRAGELLVSWAQRLLAEAEQARREVTGQRLTIRVGALQVVAESEVQQVLDRLATRRPDVRVELSANPSRDDLLAEVVAARLDTALVLDHGAALGDLGFPPPPAVLAFLDVGLVPLVLVAAPGHPLTKRRALAAAELRGERLLVSEPDDSFAMAADIVLGRGPERRYVGAIPVIRTCVERGRGIALLPRFAVAGALASGTLTWLDFRAPRLCLRLVWRDDRESSASLTDALHAMRA